MVNINTVAVTLLSLTTSTIAFTIPNTIPTPSNRSIQSNKLSFSSSSSTRLFSTPSSTTTPRSTSTRRRPKKSVRDRTSTEFISLLRDIGDAIVTAGPSAGPARTLEAYVAVSRTIQDFLPPSVRNSVVFLPSQILQRARQRGGVGGGRRRNGIFGGSSGSTTTNEETRNREAEPWSPPVALRKLFERMGATYVKLGQFIASSPTLFPNDYVLEFQKCLDATEPLEWEVIKSVIEGELGGGRKLEDAYQSVEKVPLASASIAQVHRATLKTGEAVVIKVQKPNIDQSLRADLSFVYVASRVLEFLQPDFERTSLSAVAGDVRESMLEELDFEKEAGNLEEFREYLGREGLSGIATCPKVYRQFTTKKILTMEFLDGVSMLDVDKISSFTSVDPEKTIVRALNVWTTSVTAMPWFHADVHAGNLLVLADGRVGFIDFGIVGRVGDDVFRAVGELSAALAEGDYRKMAESLTNMGAADKEVDLDGFAKDLEKVMLRLNSVEPEVTVTAVQGEAGEATSVTGRIDFDDSEVTGLLLDFVDVAENNGLKLPREFGLLVKQSLYFDRYLKILAPGLNVMTEMGAIDGPVMGGTLSSDVIDV